MPTTGIFNGTNLVVLVGTEVVAHSTSCSLSVSADLPDATTKSSGGWAEQIAGLRSWSLTTDGLATVEPTGTNYVVGDIFESPATYSVSFTGQGQLTQAPNPVA